MSTAFLATEHFRDKDSLSARMVQARYTGMYRFACRAFVDWMSDPTNAAAGNTAIDGSFPRPPQYSSSWDRNYLVMAAALYAESYQSETGQPYTPGVNDFWDLNCIVSLTVCLASVFDSV